MTNIKPDIILIVGDDINYRLLLEANCPTIKNLMSSGLNFVNAYNYGGKTGAVCKSSRLMMFKGTPWDKPKSSEPFPVLLKKSGYETFATGKWHNGSLFQMCFEKGSDVFMGGMISKNSKLEYSKKKKLDTLQSGGIFTDSLIQYIETATKKPKPYFAYIGYTEPHDPLILVKTCQAGNDARIPINFKNNHPFRFGQMRHRDEQLMKRPLDKKLLREHIFKYKTMTTYLDKQIAKVLKSLTRPTVLIFTTDNGICKGNHGLLGKQNLYQESIHLPLVVWGYQYSLPRNINTNKLVYLYDIYPTILSLAGLNKPKNHSIDLLSSKTRDYLSFKFSDQIYGIISDGWKLIYYSRIKKYQLFHLNKDPNELQAKDTTKFPLIYKRLKELLRI